MVFSLYFFPFFLLFFPPLFYIFSFFVPLINKLYFTACAERCLDTEWQCKKTCACIPRTKRCDGEKDCEYSLEKEHDEYDCTYPSKLAVITATLSYLNFAQTLLSCSQSTVLPPNTSVLGTGEKPAVFRNSGIGREYNLKKLYLGL